MKKMPAHLPPLPYAAVYLGRGGEFSVPEDGGFVGWRASDAVPIWDVSRNLGLNPNVHYAALTEESEVARLNGCGKPSWESAPEWAEWLAQEQWGGWVWFESKPRVGPIDDGIDDWLLGRLRGMYENAGEGQPNPNWRDTLERRPRFFIAEGEEPVPGFADVKVKLEWPETPEPPDLIIPADVENELSTMELDPLITAARFLGYRIEWSDEGVRGWARE